MNDWDRGLDWEAAQFSECGDGLPLVEPTPQRVAAMLSHYGLSPREVLTVLPPAFAEATWHGIAENAVMAGCRPDDLGVIAAALQGLAEPEFNLIGVATTTGSAAPMLIVNGPVAARIGLNAGGNALGPGRRANATIGRAISLILRNIGGARPGEMDMATLGQPAKYGCCLAENEQDSPWPPLHATRGHARDQSAVTVAAASGFIEVVDMVNSEPQALLATFAGSMTLTGSVGGGGTSALIGSGQPLLILPPEIAQRFHDAGWGREQVQAGLFEVAQLPLDRLSPKVAKRVVEQRRDSGSGDACAALRIAERPEDILIIVAGGVGAKAAYVPTWGSSKVVTRALHLSPK